MEPTNLLFIMSDQHSRQVLGCYGNAVAQTPNLDRLAAAGTRFAGAYCPTPICVPSRASFATGRHAHTIGSWDNAAPYTGAEAESWGHRLTEQGHRVTTVGKLHYRATDDPTGFPDQRLPMHILNGVGDLHGLLRGDTPVRPQSRQHVVEAGAGESSYTRYDRAIAAEGARWLTEAAAAGTTAGGTAAQPWALFVSFVCPHFPLIAPPEHFARFDPATLPLPVGWRPDEWADHPLLREHRRLQALDTPFDEATHRNALRAYYGLVSFLDEQIGVVLRALDEAGLRDTTRVVYTSDHGEMLGAHGMWWKSTMYEGAAGVPLILAGPDVPVGAVVKTNVSLIDCFPTIVEAVGATPRPQDADLPGRSLWTIAREPDRARTVFSEYHAVFSSGGVYMLRDERFKLIHYVGGPPQLFDLVADPDERRDLAASPEHAATLAACERELRAILDPEATDRRAKAAQQRLIAAAGGVEAIIAGGVTVPFTPAPQTPIAERNS